MILQRIVVITILLFSLPGFAVETENRILDLLEEADGFINDYPEKADSIIKIAWPLIDKDCKPQYLAHYNIIKGYVVRSRGNFNKALEAISIAKDYYSKNENLFRIAQIDLLNGLVFEELVLYKDAFEEFSKAYEFFKNSQFYNYTLRALLGMGRISLAVKEDRNFYISKADSLANNYYDKINMGHYWGNKAYLIYQHNKKNYYYTKAVEYYKENSQIDNHLIVLSKLLQSYTLSGQLDSAYLYLSEIKNISGESFSDYPSYRKADIYYYTGNYYFKKNNYVEAEKYLTLSMTEAEKTNEIIFQSLAWNLQYRIDTIYGNYKKAVKSFEQFHKYRKGFSDRIVTGQLKALNAKEGIKDTIIENKKLQLEVTKSRFQLTLILLLIIVLVNISGVVIFLVFRHKRKEKEKRIKAEYRTKEREIELHEQKSVLQDIKIKASSNMDAQRKLDSINKNLANADKPGDVKHILDIFELKYPKAREALFKRFDGLSNLEYQYMVCMIGSYSNTQIAEIMQVQPETIRKRIQRMRRKYAIKGEFSLRKYLKDGNFTP
jgi:ATP/maltotriose-dependent transcriptional regulator MalT